MAKDKIKTGKQKSLMGDEVSRQQEHDRKRLKKGKTTWQEKVLDKMENEDIQPLTRYSFGESEAESELKRAKARFLNKLSDLMEDLPDSELGKAIHKQLTKDIRT
jgi:hypothetical protein